LMVAVIGGAGRMGSWFAKYFLGRGYEVIISDINVEKAKDVAKSLNLGLAKNNIEAARIADLILVSTPIHVTPAVLSEIMPELRKNKIVAEVSSLKSNVLPTLREIANRGIKSLSIHPLFGSGARRMTGERIALIPVSDQLMEENLARRIFPEAKIIVVDFKIHDEIMALTLALTHFINIVFASVVGEENISLLKSLGGTTFTLQLAVSEAVMAEDPSLYASIQMDNEYTSKYLSRFMSKAAKLKSIVENKDFIGFMEFYKLTQEMISKDEEFTWAYEKMYRALEAFKFF